MTRIRPVWLRTTLAWLVLPVLAAALLPMALIVLFLAALDGGRVGVAEVLGDLPFRAAGDLLMGR